MKNKQLISILCLLLITIISFIGCKKEDSGADSATQKQEFASVAAQSDAEAETVYDDVFDNVMGVNAEVGVGGTGVFGRVAASGNNNLTDRTDSTVSCFIVTTTQLSTGTRFPLKIVIDFGAGCKGRDGRTRKGKIIIGYTGRLVIPGSVATTTFEGYYIDSIKVEGTHKIINKSSNDKRIYEIVVTGARLSKPSGDYSEWNSDKTITQVEGSATPYIAQDDAFSVSGQANGSVKRGNKFFQWSTVITEPLIKKFSCRWFVKGIATIKKGDTPVATLNYGTGTCDHTATFTVNGVVFEITLH